MLFPAFVRGPKEEKEVVVVEAEEEMEML